MLSLAVEKRFPGFELDVALSTAGPVLVVLAPSGSGKTLLLDCLSGLQRPDAGYLKLDDEAVFDLAAGRWPPLRTRRIGYVVQDYALFPHRSVRENVAFAMGRHPDAEALARLLSIFQLERVAGHRPEEISGGQRQRVALARALATRPRLLLLDEPFAAIDEALREELLDETLRFQRLFAIPMIFVTHNTSEARRVGGDLVILHAGRIMEFGDADRLFTHPRTVFAARFLGKRNLFSARITSEGADGLELESPLGRLVAAPGAESPLAPPNKGGWGVRVAFFIDPLELRIRMDDRPAPNQWRGTVAQVYPFQRLFRAHVRLEDVPDGPELVVDLEPHACTRWEVVEGKTLTLGAEPQHVRLCRES